MTGDVRHDPDSNTPGSKLESVAAQISHSLLELRTVPHTANMLSPLIDEAGERSPDQTIHVCGAQERARPASRQRATGHIDYYQIARLMGRHDEN
jgi:hypothetical protein